MANPNVLFSKGMSSAFEQIASKDPYTLYFLTDTKEIYLGSDKYAFGKDISVSINGVGDCVSDVSWDSSTKTLSLTLSNASDAQSVQDAIRDALEDCVKTITTARGSSILVDDTDSENLKLSLNIATGSNAGNVLIEECSDGLRASVDIPEDTIQGVDSNDKILSVDGALIKSTLTIDAVKENGITYVVLKGVGQQEVSRFDASEFVKDGILDSVALEYATDGSNDRLLVFTFNTDSGKETIKINVQEFIDIYNAKASGGLKVENNEFSIDNEVTASGPINSDVAPSFGETITFKAVKYDSHGLITGTGDFTFKMPDLIGGDVGGSSKLIKSITVDSTGALVGTDIDISTALSASSTDNQIPTAKAVYDAIEDAKTCWERF